MARAIPLLILLIMTQLVMGCGTTSLLMKDGRKVHGMIVSSDANSIQLESAMNRRIVTVNRSDVEDVELAGEAAATTGMTLTFTGAILTVVGAAVMGSSGSGWDGFGEAIIGFLCVVGGVPMLLIGPPLWTGGNSLQADQKALYEFDGHMGAFQRPNRAPTYKLTLRF